ncbi:GNAT family N-acetyltransferase [Erysipelothrix aquatica]|uniref:GNAT family N-acetyltransferase n=1 Tax=Erysipelothrix aquatica TaxID=2683714 RepID=UPI0013585D8E|nr:GNAT family N-acetyltransferase [Erysipelothrix aquatica]
MKFEETLTPEATDVIKLRELLRKYNRQNFETLEHSEFAIYIRDEDENIVGGISGEIFGNWVDVKYLVIHEDLRGQGLGKALLEKVENMAIEHRCRYIFLNTFGFQGKDFYPKFGFREVYVKQDYPLTGTHHFFVKELSY